MTNDFLSLQSARLVRLQRLFLSPPSPPFSPLPSLTAGTRPRPAPKGHNPFCLSCIITLPWIAQPVPRDHQMVLGGPIRARGSRGWCVELPGPGGRCGAGTVGWTAGRRDVRHHYNGKHCLALRSRGQVEGH